MIEQVLRNDSDFDAFCLDYFPAVYQTFTGDMVRKSKMNLLLEQENLQALGQALVDVGGDAQPWWIMPLDEPQPEKNTPSGLQPPGAPYDRRWYIDRPEDYQRIEQAMQHRTPAVLMESRGYGKTWFIQRLMEINAHDHRVALIDFQTVSPLDGGSQERLWYWFATELFKSLKLPQEKVEAAFKRNGTPRSQSAILTDLMENQILAASPQPVLLALDNADRWMYLYFQAEFLNMLRAWFDQTDEPWQHLRLVLSVSTMQALLPEDAPWASPFNIGQLIRLRSFTAEQIQNLAGLHGLTPNAAEIDHLLDLTGGHPYLSRLALYHVALQGRSLHSVLQEAEHDPRRGVFAAYLDTLHRWFNQDSALSTSMRRLQEDPAATIEKTVLRRLEQAGLIMPAGTGQYVPRLKLYRHLAG